MAKRDTENLAEVNVSKPRGASSRTRTSIDLGSAMRLSAFDQSSRSSATPRLSINRGSAAGLETSSLPTSSTSPKRQGQQQVQTSSSGIDTQLWEAIANLKQEISSLKEYWGAEADSIRDAKSNFQTRQRSDEDRWRKQGDVNLMMTERLQNLESATFELSSYVKRTSKKMRKMLSTDSGFSDIGELSKGMDCTEYINEEGRDIHAEKKAPLRNSLDCPAPLGQDVDVKSIIDIGRTAMGSSSADIEDINNLSTIERLDKSSLPSDVEQDQSFQDPGEISGLSQKNVAEAVSSHSVYEVGLQPTQECEPREMLLVAKAEDEPIRQEFLQNTIIGDIGDELHSLEGSGQDCSPEESSLPIRIDIETGGATLLPRTSVDDFEPQASLELCAKSSLTPMESTPSRGTKSSLASSDCTKTAVTKHAHFSENGSSRNVDNAADDTSEPKNKIRNTSKSVGSQSSAARTKPNQASLMRSKTRDSELSKEQNSNGDVEWDPWENEGSSDGSSSCSTEEFNDESSPLSALANQRKSDAAVLIQRFWRIVRKPSCPMIEAVEETEKKRVASLPAIVIETREIHDREERKSKSLKWSFKYTDPQSRLPPAPLMLPGATTTQESCFGKQLGVLASHVVHDGKQTAPSAIHDAAKEGNEELCLVLLLTANYRMTNYTDSVGRTALHMAALYNLPKLCAALLEHELFEMADAVQWGGWTALHLAARQGHAETVKMIISSPRFHMMNTKDEEGRTVLHCAAVSGNVEVVKAILKNPSFALAGELNYGGYSALHIAERHGHADACKIVADHLTESNRISVRPTAVVSRCQGQSRALGARHTVPNLFRIDSSALSSPNSQAPLFPA